VSVLQTATVVGGDGQGPVDVDEYGRILLRFHWDLEGRYTCRVRVQQPWQGGEKGALFIPRIGSEVSVACEMGNPDSPLVLGSLPNRARMPSWKLPSQSNLSGLRSREATAEGGNSPGANGNHVLFDDTPGKVHFQAFSSHQYSQLSLGFFCFIDGTAGRTRLRGQGYELRTDGHGALRAARGLLHTTDARPNADSHATDIREAAERLGNAQQLHQSLSEAAQAASAHDAGDQTPVVQALQQQNNELKGSGGNAQDGQFPEFQSPHILSASAAGIQSVAEGSTHIASNEHTALTSGGHTSISAGKSLLASVKDAVRLFAYKAGMKLVSASADIDLQALKTSINLLAQLNITASADCIDINAKTRLSLSGGGSNITLASGSIVQKTSGGWVAHAASFDMNGPASGGSPALPQATKLPLGQLDILNQYVNRAEGRAPQGVRQGGFTVLDAEGGRHGGTLDGNGFNTVAGIPMGMAEVTYERDPRDPWDDGSYLGEGDWPTKSQKEALDARPVDAAPSSALQSASALLRSGGVQQALKAGQMAQAVQQGGAKALMGPAQQLAAAALPKLTAPAVEPNHTEIPA
jgi:type VI secretion system secreted protein VgrG